MIGIGGGYAGGIADEALSLLSNVVLVIPALPLIIVHRLVRARERHLADGRGDRVRQLGGVGPRAAGAERCRCATASTCSPPRPRVNRAWRIVLFEILPNELPIIVSQFIFSMIFAILTEAGLAFLGLANPSQLTWGNHLVLRAERRPWPAGPGGGSSRPACASPLLGMGLALINFSLDEILNPRLRVYQSPQAQARPSQSLPSGPEATA